MTLNCAIGVVLINLIIFVCFIIGVVLPAMLTGFLLYSLCKLIYFKIN